MNINLHIERLVLNGLDFESRNGPQLQAAVETELARLLGQGGLGQDWQTGGAVPGVRAGDIRLTAQGGAGDLGKQIAGSIYGSIGKAE